MIEILTPDEDAVLQEYQRLGITGAFSDDQIANGCNMSCHRVRIALKGLIDKKKIRVTKNLAEKFAPLTPDEDAVLGELGNEDEERHKSSGTLGWSRRIAKRCNMPVSRVRKALKSLLHKGYFDLDTEIE